MSEWRYIIAAYVFAWVVLVGYGLYVRMRHGQASRRYEAEAANGGTS